MIFGTFDRLHPGHRDFFRQASKLGNVFAVVARCENVHKIKNRPPIEPERSRLAKVALAPEISRAMLGDREDFLRVIEKIKPDIIALGFDQKTFSTQEL